MDTDWLLPIYSYYRKGFQKLFIS